MPFVGEAKFQRTGFGWNLVLNLVALFWLPARGCTRARREEDLKLAEATTIPDLQIAFKSLIVPAKAEWLA